jgi:ParB family transcriptional regulator, chromosome partitioning protein
MTTILISLSHLKLSALNVRKTDSRTALEELKASIAAHGLQQNLVISKGKRNAFEVVAGGRRLTALLELQTEGKLPEDYAAPCKIVGKDEAREISLAENIVRAAMHPYGQFTAWRQLAEQSHTAAAIAERFGVSEQLVTKRLKLARVAPALLECYRDGEMTLEQLEVFTLSDDHSRQTEVWEAVRRSYNRSSGDIRRMLTTESVPSYHGELEVHEGLIDPEDTAAADAQPKHSEPEEKEPVKKGYSQALRDDLTSLRAQVMQWAVAQDFSLAFDLAVYSLCRGKGLRHNYDRPVNIIAHRDPLMNLGS